MRDNQADSVRKKRPDKTREERETIVYIRVGEQGHLPLYATEGSSGCDLMAGEDLQLLPGQTCLLPLDLVMALQPDVEAQIRPRSGLSLRTSLRLPNTPGTIDSDYRSPVGVLLENTFSQADLPMLVLRNPALAEELCQPDRRMSLARYLESGSGTRPSGKDQDQLQAALVRLPDLAGQTVYLDERGNPYGTLYIRRGERIAQMVFSRWVKARFVRHEQPETVGQNRGGGFGSTGI